MFQIQSCSEREISAGHARAGFCVCRWVHQLWNREETVRNSRARDTQQVRASAARAYPAHKRELLLRRPNASAPTLVGTKLLLPIPPERLRKSASRWVTHVAVLHARFCAVTLTNTERERASAQGSRHLYMYVHALIMALSVRLFDHVHRCHHLTCRNLDVFVEAFNKLNVTNNLTIKLEFLI